jgi:DNA (cytosine-5)-methyltransferase 1
MTVTVGSLFSGYGGLEIGLAAALGADYRVEVIWYSENARHPATVMAARHPDAPNLGDVSAVEWSAVPPVDVLTGGTPCQDLSHAGKRGGMTEGTRSNLWVAMREAVAVLRPKLVIWENVRGAFSARADSEMEPCPGCMGNPPGRNLRAFGRVLGDLASIRYDTDWVGLPASGVDAPHRRYRVFLIAYPQPVPHGEPGNA